jgi:hypothetical protein
MAMLSHTQLSTAQRYIHATQEGRAALTEKYTASITTAAQKSSKEANDNA